MKLASRTYSIGTNACLIVAVVSAFQFDGTSHNAWLILGGCAAVIAMTMYFVRHWQPKRRTELSRSALFQASQSRMALQDGEGAVPNVLLAYVYGAPATPIRFDSYLTPKAWESPWTSPKFYRKSIVATRDPAEQVSRIVKRLQATGRQYAYTVAIAPDGRVTLKITDVAENPRSSPARPFAGPVSATVH